MADYVTKQAILEEAGLSQPVLGELVSGNVDGSNKVFSVGHKPLADANYDDDVDPYDITLYVNGSPIDVDEVDPASGAITAHLAPPADATVTADYRYSNVLDQYVEEVREEAQDWIDSEMDAVDPLPYAQDAIPPTIRKIARVYAAGMLLAKDYGFQQASNDIVNSGDAMMRRAEAWLARYIAIGGSTGLSDVSAAEMEAASDPELFQRWDGTTAGYVSPDHRFMQNRDDF